LNWGIYWIGGWSWFVGVPFKEYDILFVRLNILLIKIIPTSSV